MECKLCMFTHIAPDGSTVICNHPLVPRQLIVEVDWGESSCDVGAPRVGPNKLPTVTAVVGAMGIKNFIEEEF